MGQVAFLSSSEIWRRGHGPNHPLKPERLKRTHELLEEYGALAADNVTVIAPRPASFEELSLFHTAEYIEVVHALSEGNKSLPVREYGFGSGDNPVFPGMYDSEGLKVGSALQGARLLVNDEYDVAFSYSGGLHHGGPDFASGFCVFNDAAVVIQWLVDKGFKVAYVDIDVHHGDGVQNAFYSSPKVLTISFHQDGRTLFPGTGFISEIGSGDGKGYNVNVPLPAFTGDKAYLWAFNEIVPRCLTRFKADVVVTQLGVDTHADDPLANLLLTTAGQDALFETLGRLADRWLALGGGGYAIDVVPRAWTLAFGHMAGLTWPELLPQAYSEHYGGSWLRDRHRPQLDPASQARIQNQVEVIIQRVKRIHALD